MNKTFQEVTVEKSPAVRRMLSDVVECILLKEQGTESNEALLKAVFIEVSAMMESDNCEYLYICLILAWQISRNLTWERGKVSNICCCCLKLSYLIF